MSNLDLNRKNYVVFKKEKKLHNRKKKSQKICCFTKRSKQNIKIIFPDKKLDLLFVQ